MRIAVAGGTGVVGSLVVQEIEKRGNEAVVLTRSTGCDLTTGDGLEARLASVEAVIDVTSTRSQSKRKASEFFGVVTRNLLAAEKAAGVDHHVALSIVGIDDVPTGYYKGKLHQEQTIANGDVPWSILRATQFHEFAEQALSFVKIGPWSLVPQMSIQPVAAQEVAAALVDIAMGEPQGRTPDLAGPEPLELVKLARTVNDHKSLGRRVVGLKVPGAGGRGMRSGALRPATDGPRGTLRFQDWSE